MKVATYKADGEANTEEHRSLQNYRIYQDGGSKI